MDKLFEALDRIISKKHKISMSSGNVIEIREKSSSAKCTSVQLKTRGKVCSFSLDIEGAQNFSFLSTEEGAKWNKSTDGIVVTCKDDIIYIFIIELKSTKPETKQIPYGKIHFEFILNLIEEAFKIPKPPKIEYRGLIFGTKKLVKKGLTSRRARYTFIENDSNIIIIAAEGNQKYILTDFME